MQPNPQNTAVDQTIRTSKSLLWGVSIALSWMWGLGLFFSVQIAVQFGIVGLLSFATANAMGLVLFGFYTAQIARRRRTPEAFERTFFDGTRRFRGAIYFYQILAIVLTLFSILHYLVQPLGISLPLVCLVFFGVTFFLGEEFDIAKIKYSHAYFAIGIFASMAVLLYFVLPQVGLGGNVTLEGVWPIYDAANFENFSYYMYYMIPVVVGFLLGPWLDLQQWQRAVQIRKEGLSILGSYVCGAIVFFFLLLFHGVLALAIVSGSAVDLIHPVRDGLFHAKDVVVNFFLLPDNELSFYFGFYMAFLSLCVLTTFDSAYLALRWFMEDLIGGSKNIVFAVLPQRLFTSPLPHFFFAGFVALAGAYLGAELEYFMSFYGSFLIGYQIIFYRKMAFDLKGTNFPVMKLFSVSLFSIAIFGIGYFYLRSALMAIGSIVPLFYGIYLSSGYQHHVEPLFARGTAAEPEESGVEGDVEATPSPARHPEPVPVAGLSVPIPSGGADTGLPAIRPGRGISTYFDGKWFVHTFTATYADTNSVGNIYFGTYAMWVGKTRELFFHTVMPEFDLKTTDFYILTRAFEHKYLKEAREFEQITVKLRIGDYNRKFATLEHQILDSKGDILGKGKQTLLFVSSSDYRILDIPEAAVRAFIAYA